MDNEYTKKINELKEIIVDLKMDLINAQIPVGHCPYSYYATLKDGTISCEIGCNKCREIFMNMMECRIRQEVNAI